MRQASMAPKSSARPMLVSKPPRACPDARPAAHPLLVLQSQIGNQAVLRQLTERSSGVRQAGKTAPCADLNPAAPATAALLLARQTESAAPQPLQTTTAQAEREREVEAINVGGTNYVLYQTKVRGGGSSAWLANNPGNLDYTDDTVAWGGYEDKKLVWGAHRFAIFPDESTGVAAVRAFLRKHQTTRNITLMMNLFAPAGDLKNNPTQYSQKVADKIGPPVTVNTLVKDLTDDQIQLFAEAIKEQEGWTPGPVNDVPRGDPSLPEQVRSR